MFKQLYRIGFIAYLFLFIFSVLFYKERIAFIDLAFHLFCIIQQKTFAIQNFRFVAICTQIFPLFARQLRVSLNGCMLIYSLGFICYYFLCYIICGSLLKNYRLAIVLLLINILFVTHTFYWAQSELPQGLAIMVVLFALMNDSRPRMFAIQILLIIFLTVTVTFSHPLILFPFLYALAFFYLEKDAPVRQPTIVLVFITILLTLIIKKIYFSNTHDEQSMATTKNFIRLFPHYFHIYSNSQFVLNCFRYYYWIPVLFILITALYIKQKKWKNLSLFITALFGYLFLVDVSFPSNSTPEFYIENLYLPVGVFIALPFVYDVLPVINRKHLPVIITYVIIITAIIRIYHIHNIYSDRLGWERRFLDKNINRKLLVDQKKVPIDSLIMTWATPYEFWLLSTTERRNTASIIITDNAPSYSWIKTLQNQFIGTWGVFPYSSLPKQYFIFKDSTTTYSDY